jgi:hypothetical protein
MTLSDMIEKAREEITAKGLEEKLVILDAITEHLMDVAQKIAAVKAAQHGPMFWQCDCGPLEDLDDSIAALETALREAIHE